MRQSPSIVPLDHLDCDVYLVVEDFGARAGCSWRETDEQDTDRETMLRDLISGQYAYPFRIAFNAIEGWSRDATMLLKAIKRYYNELDARLREDCPLSFLGLPIVLVTTEGWNPLTDKALALVLSFSSDVIAVHLTKLDPDEAEEKEARLRRQWEDDVDRPAREAALRPPRLVMIQALYRDFQGRC